MSEALGYVTATSIQAPLIQPSAHLAILQGPRRGGVIALGTGSIGVGRADLDPADTRISRTHAKITFRGDTFWLEDASKNGTWVDNQRVFGEVPLRSGAVITICNSVLRLEVEGPPAYR